MLFHRGPALMLCFFATVGYGCTVVVPDEALLTATGGGAKGDANSYIEGDQVVTIIPGLLSDQQIASFSHASEREFQMAAASARDASGATLALSSSSSGSSGGHRVGAAHGALGLPRLNQLLVKLYPAGRTGAGGVSVRTMEGAEKFVIRMSPEDVVAAYERLITSQQQGNIAAGALNIFFFIVAQDYESFQRVFGDTVEQNYQKIVMEAVSGKITAYMARQALRRVYVREQITSWLGPDNALYDQYEHLLLFTVPFDELTIFENVQIDPDKLLVDQLNFSGGVLEQLAQISSNQKETKDKAVTEILTEGDQIECTRGQTTITCRILSSSGRIRVVHARRTLPNRWLDGDGTWMGKVHEFDLGVIFSVITGLILHRSQQASDIAIVIGFVTGHEYWPIAVTEDGYNVFLIPLNAVVTHEDEARAIILSQYPELGNVEVPESFVDEAAVWDWLAKQEEEFGTRLRLAQAPAANGEIPPQ